MTRLTHSAIVFGAAVLLVGSVAAPFMAGTASATDTDGPGVNFTSPTPGSFLESNETTEFNITINSSHNISNVTWDFDADGVADATTQNTTHTFNVNESTVKPVIVRVTDENGNTTIRSMPVYIEGEDEFESVVESTSVKYLAGTKPDMANMSVNARSVGDHLVVNVVDSRQTSTSLFPSLDARELTSLGADNTTRVKVNVTVSDFDGDIMLGSAKNGDWTTTEHSNDSTTVTIWAEPSQVEYITSRSTYPWPNGSNDTADVGVQNMIGVHVVEMDELDNETRGDFEGSTIFTNAQRFSAPEYSNGSLSVSVAAPHFTTNGSEHDGYYDVFIPNDVLETWNVSNPEEELQASYQNDSANFTVNETTEGVWVRMDIHYSQGEVVLSNNSSAIAGATNSALGGDPAGMSREMLALLGVLAVLLVGVGGYIHKRKDSGPATYLD